jgi:hypothetical protein
MDTNKGSVRVMPATANEPPTAHLITMQTALARALSVEEINQLGRDTGQRERLRTVTPHRLFRAPVTPARCQT